MKQYKLLAHQHRFGVLMVGLTLLILGLAFFAAPATTSAQNAPNDTTPPGTVPPNPALRPSVTFIHAAPFDADVALTAVDICTDDGNLVPGMDGITYGGARTLSLDPSLFDWMITTAGSNCQNVLLDIELFSLGYGTVRVLVFTGDIVNQPLVVLDVLAQEGGGVIFMPVIIRSSSSS